MVEVALVVTIGTVLILLGLTVVAAWIVPAVLSEESGEAETQSEQSEQTPRRPPA